MKSLDLIERIQAAIVRFCAIPDVLHKFLKNNSRNFQKSIDGFFWVDIMRPLLLLQREVEEAGVVGKKPENTD